MGSRLQKAHSKVRSVSDTPRVMRAQEYRTEAKRLREEAAEMRTPEIVWEIEHLASLYELLAEGVERIDPSAQSD
jgi:hypothetical protein